MAIPLTGTGGLFTRLGAIGRTYNQVITDLGNASGNIGDLVNDIEAQYLAANFDVTSGLYSALADYRGTPATFFSYLVGLATRTLVAMAEDDTPQPNSTLANALGYLIRQMEANSDSLNRPTVSVGSVTAGGGNVGNGALQAISVSPDGSYQPYFFEEDIVFLCTQDAGTGGTRYSELFSVAAPAAVDRSAWNWPDGSGVGSTLTSINPQTTGLNILTNSAFDAFTSNTPDDWTVEVGTPGNDILAGGAGASYDGVNCLRFLQFSGSPLSEIYQAVTLTPLTAYAVSFQAKKSAGLSGAGVLRIALTDVDGTVLTDPQGNPCSASYTLSGWTTGYVRKTATFHSPRILPSGGVYLTIKLTTAIADSGESVYLDWLAVSPYSQLYLGGPQVALFSGIDSWQQGDILTLPANNNYAGAMLLWLDRAWGLRENGFIIPTSGSPTVPDSLIT